jgi:type I restriction enzyme M protein
MSKTIKCIADMLKLLEQHNSGHYVYRGQPRSDFTLHPKLGRHIQKGWEWADVEKTLINEFKQKSIPYLSSPPNGDIQWLALAQHHGLATRLLDWSKNPLVALYFAVTNSYEDSDSVFYALNTKEFDYIDDYESPFSHGKVVLHEPSHISPRITAQRGVFSVHANPTVEFKSKYLKKWIIPKEDAANIFFDLDTLGISTDILFPGLDGIARKANEDCSLE